eukprot:GHVR01110071.1.p1 GENE.GHVR01110071.1~~GHVR01110071.1.p1  ORF type:complete len:491 (+),score=101.81 GHVR01110071.1:113-1585(+)
MIKHYCRSAWNWLDAVVVLASMIEFILTLSATTTTGFNIDNLRTLKSLRVMRAFRPLRVIARSSGLNLIVNSLIASLPSLGNVFLICFIFFLIFAILGVNQFKGGFYKCILPDYICDNNNNTTTTNNSINCTNIINNIDDIDDCLLLQGKWVNKDVNFDNVANALIALFQVSSTEGWLDVMVDGIDSVGPHKQPKHDHRWWISIYFMLFMIVGNFFAINLFVGVIIDNFTQMKNDRSGGFITESQERWLQIQKIMLIPRSQKYPNILPIKNINYKNNIFGIFMKYWNKSRVYIYNIVINRWFDIFIMLCIVLNTLIMCMKYATMSTVYGDLLENFNFVFAMIFNFEAAVKIFAYGFKRYFTDGWNIFDFIIILVTNVAILVQSSLDGSEGFSSIVPVVRAFRVGRVLRMIRQASGLRVIFQTMLNVIPSLGNISGVVLLMLVIFAILGMNLFGKVKYGDSDGGINPNANFQSDIYIYIYIYICSQINMYI